MLKAAGLIAVEKGYQGRRGRTWITLTPAGVIALAAEIGRLRPLIARVETTGSVPDGKWPGAAVITWWDAAN